MFLFAGGCSRKRNFYCGMASGYYDQVKVDSRVLRLERISEIDSSIALIYGNVFSEEYSDSVSYNEPLCGAIVIATDQATQKTYGKPTDFDGTFSLSLSPAEYTLKVVYTGYSSLIVPNVAVKRGDKIVFNSLLGRSSSAQDSTIVIKVTDGQRQPK
jgi:hypothetical protein